MTESRFTVEHNGIESNKRHLKIPKKGHFVTMNFLFIPFVTSWMDGESLLGCSSDFGWDPVEILGCTTIESTRYLQHRSKISGSKFVQVVA
jgi:hypothetical protein